MALRPSVVPLPPPLDARTLRISLARTPRVAVVTTAVVRAPVVVRLVVRIARAAAELGRRVYRCWAKSERTPVAVAGPRPPPGGEPL